MHFWDSPDDINGADMELVFERDRMYLHGAQVRPAVPLYCSCFASHRSAVQRNQGVVTLLLLSHLTVALATAHPHCHGVIHTYRVILGPCLYVSPGIWT